MSQKVIRHPRPALPTRIRYSKAYIQEGVLIVIRRLILGRITAAEKMLGVPLDYCKFIARTSLRASMKFAKFLAVDEYRRVLPAGPCYVARIVALRHDDCGTCVQIAVNQAKKAGV